MGRRKIEIRAIRDDRNRSVTFLKRKGGLFKKAYELGVLCSVDVAVIVFGNNKKLYQFCSGDINQTLTRYQYHAGAPHEHKGPADFEGKRGGDDDDDEDDGEGAHDISPPVSHMHDTPEPMPAGRHRHHIQNQPSYQYMRHTTASASPPQRHMSIHRSMTPQSQAYSRPASRMTGGPRRSGSSLNFTQQQGHPPPPPLASQSGPAPYPQHAHHQQMHSQHHQPQHSVSHSEYSYTSNPQYYPAPPPPPPPLNLPPVASAARAGSPEHGLPSMPPMQDGYHSHMPPHQQYHAAPPPPRHTPTPDSVSGPPPSSHQQYHMHHIPPYSGTAGEPRHSSVPPMMASQHSPPPSQAPPPPSGPPQLGLQTAAYERSKVSPQMRQVSAQSSSDHLAAPRAVGAQASSATHSIFTPIDDSRSLLAQHWGGSSAISGGEDREGSRGRSSDRSPQLPHRSPPIPRSNIDPRMTDSGGPPKRERSRSKSPASGESQKMSRSNTLQSADRNKPRLKLKVQIPGEGGEGSAVEGSAAESVAATSNVPSAAAAAPPQQQNKGVVLPPPSPSARNPLLSAGATGPYNPFAFAKPQIPSNANGSSHGNGSTAASGQREPLETPLSALPSRVMDGNMLPSPSDIWNNVWGKSFGENMMPSPINFQNTPIYQSVPNFRELAPADDRKRKADTEGAPAGLEKRIKT